MAIDIDEALVGTNITPQGYLALIEDELSSSPEEVVEALQDLANFMYNNLPASTRPCLIHDGKRWLFACAPSEDVQQVATDNRQLRKINVHALASKVVSYAQSQFHLKNKMSERLPVRPGHIWTESREETPAPTQPAKFSLGDLSREFHFFNHGALFTYGGLKFPDEDPLNDWYAQQPKGTIVVREAFQSKLFEGLDTLAGNGTTWNHILCAVRHDDWNSLWTFLCGTAMVDRKAHKYCEVFSGDIEILDPVHLERFSIFHERGFSHVPITVFGIDGNEVRWEPVLHRGPVTGAVGFSKQPPRPVVVGRGRLLLDGDMSQLSNKDNQAMVQIMKETMNAR